MQSRFRVEGTFVKIYFLHFYLYFYDQFDHQLMSTDCSCLLQRPTLAVADNPVSFSKSFRKTHIHDMFSVLKVLQY
jgi:hypothetical protein